MFEIVYKALEKEPLNFDICEDLYSLVREKEEEPNSLVYGKKLKDHLEKYMAKYDNLDYVLDFYNRLCLFLAPNDFDSYLIYLEKNREPEKRFYLPRRKQLRKVVDALQELYNGDLNEMSLSTPPRVGKTSILMFYLTWLMGKDPERSNLYSSYSYTVVKVFFNGILEILQDTTTYTWHEIFPKVDIVRTDSDGGIVDLGRRKKYATLTARSIDGTLNGACDCDGLLIADDLLEGIEEAMNNDRLNKKWATVDNNLLTRCKASAKILWVGTRWSIQDPIGKRLDLLENDPNFGSIKHKTFEIPALDKNDHSNFEYLFNVGFTSEYYIQKRASFERNNDIASWSAQYMQEPIEREGVLFTPEGMQYYNGDLPLGEPDRAFGVTDPAFGGGDYTATPIALQYGQDFYLVDVVFDDRDKSVVRPRIVEKIIKHNVSGMQIEATKMTEDYAKNITDMLRAKNYRCNITTKPAPSNVSKGQRIFDAAPDIREHVYFLAPQLRNDEYNRFMMQVFNYKVLGKNKHDDAPDSLAQLMKYSQISNHVEVIKRPF